MRLNDKAVKALKPKDAKYYIHGDMSNGRHGFAICVNPGGTKAWFFIYRFEGKRYFLPLGKYPTISLEEAGKKFDEHWKIYASGKNPKTVEADREAALEAAPTVKKLGEEYIERWAKVNKKSWQEDQRILEKEIYPAWGRRKAQDITKGNIIALLEKVVDRGSPQTANNIFKILRKMFNWAVEKDRLKKVSPCIGVKAPAPVTTKDRALKVDEIKTLWQNLDDPDISMTYGVRQALRLILVTAQRPGEVAGMHTREIEGDWWEIPGERTKNGRLHRVYLSRLAQEIIAQAIEWVKWDREIPEDQEYDGFVFPCPHKAKDKPIERHALSKALKRNTSEDETVLGVLAFTPHDLRRSANTLMAASKIIKEHRERVLNHTLEKLDATYNKYDYDDEKIAALEALERKLRVIISCGTVPDNVRSLEQARGKVKAS